MASRPVLVLAGGVGAARFLRGLVQVVPPEEIVVIGNTGDDLWWHGLYVSPDLDTVTYWLAGLADETRGWGIRNDTFHTQTALTRLTRRTWFQLGDRDLATHIYRTGQLRAGFSLSAITDELTAHYGVASQVVPMSNDRVTTRLKTDVGDLHFQEYFVRERCRPEVREIYWTGLERARPTPGIAGLVASARAVLIAPSNPVISIGPILRIAGMREMISAVRDRTVAVSPLIAGRAVKGPTVELMRAQGVRPDAVGVAEQYQDIAAGFVIDAADQGLRSEVAAMGYRVAVEPTLLDDAAAAQTVAAAALDLLQRSAAA